MICGVHFVEHNTTKVCLLSSNHDWAEHCGPEVANAILAVGVGKGMPAGSFPPDLHADKRTALDAAVRAVCRDDHPATYDHITRVADEFMKWLRP